MDEKQLSKLTVVQLKALLRENHLPVSGRKAQLVSRLVSQYKNTSKPSEQKVTKSPKVVETVKPQKIPKKKEDSFSTSFSSNDNFTQTVNTFSPPTESTQFYANSLTNNTDYVIDSSYVASQPVEQSNLHFLLPVIGSKDTKQSLDSLLEKGFISDAEYKQRLELLSFSNVSDSLSGLSLNDNLECNTKITFSEFKDWCSAIDTSNSSVINNILNRCVKAMKEIKEDSAIHQENYERICAMICKIEPSQQKLFSLQPLFNQLNSIISTAKEEVILIYTLQIMTHLAKFAPTPRENFLKSSQDVLISLIEGQVEDIPIYSSELSNALMECWRHLLKASTYPLLKKDTNTNRLTLATDKITKKYSYVRTHSLRVLSCLCYFKESMDFILDKIPYFLENIFSYLSSRNLPTITSAISVFINVTSSTDDLTEKTIQLGVLDKLLFFLRQYSYDNREDVESLLTEVYFCLSNYAAGTISQIEGLLQRGILPIMLDTFSNLPLCTQKELGWTLGNLLDSNAPSKYFDDVNIFLLAYEILTSPQLADALSETIHKGLRTAKRNKLPDLHFEHPDYFALLELIQD